MRAACPSSSDGRHATRNAPLAGGLLATVGACVVAAAHGAHVAHVHRTGLRRPPAFLPAPTFRLTPPAFRRPIHAAQAAADRTLVCHARHSCKPGGESM